MSDYERIKKVILYLEQHYLDQPDLKVLARVAGLSEFHFHRLFTRWAGVTPKDFLKFLTAQHAKKLLHESRDLLHTSLESGLSGPSRLHDLMVTVEAVTPGEYKSQGAGVVIEYGYHDSPFGTFLIGITKRGICYLAFCDDKKKVALQELKEIWAKAEIHLNQKSTAVVAKKIFDSKNKGKVPLLLMGTSFQLKVWEALLNIPESHLVSYKDLAQLIGSPKASRAVGSAVGKNDIAFLIPCHRVIRESGVVGEYRWGGDRKKAMLAWESSHKKK